MTTLDEIIELRRAMQLFADTEEAAKNGNMLDVVQPNGKKLRHCTGAEIRETAEWLKKMGERLDRLNAESSHVETER